MMAIGAARYIPEHADPFVARTAILSIVIGLVLLVAIVGGVVITVARMMTRRQGSAPEMPPATDFSAKRVQSPMPVPTPVPVTGPRQCPVCEATIPDDSPEGLCPKCVLGRCLKAPESPVLSPKAAETAPFDGPLPPPVPGDLATKFAGLEILELLGQGGMGAVYKARQTKLDRIVAVKILPAEWGKDPAFAERFAREAKALARLSHPHVVAVHDFGESDGLFYLVMEYVDGANLRNILANGGLEPHEALAIVPQICDALQYAHEEGIVHRDIKPENILLDSKGRVKIADFGLAKLTNRPRATFTLTGSQQIMGTLDYMAPEQRLSPQQVDHRADIYSLGVVFYEMLTGELPLGRFAPPSSKPGVDRRLDHIVFRALEREPEQRYQRISEVKSELSAISNRSSPLPTPTPAEVVPRELSSDIRRFLHRTAFDMLFLALFIAICGFANLYASFEQAVSPSGEVLFILGVFCLPISGLVALAAAKARNGQSYHFVRAMTMVAMLPWSVCFPISLILGCWILMRLGNPAVRAAFEAGRRPDAGRRPARQGPGRITDLGGGVLCVPIKLGTVWERQYPGLLRIEDDTLVLEYTTGHFRAKVKEATLPIRLLRQVRVTHGWWSSMVVLQMASLKYLEGIPTGAQGRLELSISHKDRQAAEQLVLAIQQKASSVEVQRYPGPVWKDENWPAIDSPVGPPPMPAPQPTGPVRRKLRSLFNSVYTMFFSRVKDAETPRSDPSHERSPSQP
jgi:tRNA A-37 threonylcarbamoyl transferase component Bud32